MFISPQAQTNVHLGLRCLYLNDLIYYGKLLTIETRVMRDLRIQRFLLDKVNHNVVFSSFDSNVNVNYTCSNFIFSKLYAFLREIELV